MTCTFEYAKQGAACDAFQDILNADANLQSHIHQWLCPGSMYAYQSVSKELRDGMENHIATGLENISDCAHKRGDQDFPHCAQEYRPVIKSHRRHFHEIYEALLAST